MKKKIPTLLFTEARLIFIHIDKTFCICPFLVAFFSATIDGRNLIFGHKLHIGTPYRGKHFFDLSDSYFLFAEERGYHKWANSSCFTWNFLTCSVTGAVDRVGHTYPFGAPDVTSGPVFLWRFILQVLQFLCRLIHVHLYSLCSVIFVYPSLLSCSCVLSRFCLVFGFFRFWIIPLPCSFGILLPIREPFSRHTNIYSVIEDTFQMC